MVIITDSIEALENEHKRVHLDKKRVFGAWDASFESPVFDPFKLACLDERVKFLFISILVTILVVHLAHASDEVAATFAHSVHIVEATSRNVTVHEDARPHDDIKSLEIVAGKLVDPSAKPNLAHILVALSRSRHLVKLGRSICA